MIVSTGARSLLGQAVTAEAIQQPGFFGGLPGVGRGHLDLFLASLAVDVGTERQNGRVTSCQSDQNW